MTTERQETTDGWEIIGSTVVAEDDVLPMLLSPILRTVRDDTHYYLPDDAESMVEPNAWPRELRGWVDDELEYGSMMRIDPPMEWHSDHVVLQADADRPPELLPANQLAARLAALGRDALVQASSNLANGERGRAADKAWYALRALPDEPFALLAVIALERGGLPDTGLAELLSAWHEFPDERRAASLEKHQRDARLGTLVALMRDDPAHGHGSVVSDVRRPAYLRRYPNHPGFIHESRRLWKTALASRMAS